MTRLQKLNNDGWKITNNISNGVITSVWASKNNGMTKIKGSSITNLHKQIFGY